MSSPAPFSPSSASSASHTASTLDRRAHPRSGATFPVRYGLRDDFASGELLDLSVGGIGLRGEKMYPQGTEIEIRFRASNAKEDLLSLRALVRHASDSRMGVEFVNMRTKDLGRTLEMLKSLMARQRSK